MKKQSRIIVLSVLAILVSYSLNAQNGVLGDVKLSLLEPSTFRTQSGPGWVLMDGGADLLTAYGQTWTGTKLAALMAREDMPDARGMFLRGQNEGREDGRQDPDMVRKVGSYQSDILRAHQHYITGHQMLPGGGSGNGNLMGQPGGGARTGDRPTDQTIPAKAAGTETRPKNITVYIYIKVN